MLGEQTKQDGALRAPGQVRVEKQRTQAWDYRARCLPSALVHTQPREAVFTQGCYDSLCSLKICQPRLTDLFRRRRLFPGAPLVGGASRACSQRLCPRAQLRMGSRLSTSMLSVNEWMVKRFSPLDHRLDSLGSTLWKGAGTGANAGAGTGTDCLPAILLSLSMAALWISWPGTYPGQCPLLSLWSSSAICAC